MNSKAETARRQTGFSLIESLIGLAITSVAIGASLPGFETAKERRHLEGASAQLETDIHLARSEAALRAHTLRLSFASSAAGSCYVIHSGGASACRCHVDASSVCEPGARALRTVGFGTAGPLQLRSNVASIVFDPAKGTVTPTGTMRFTGQQGREVRLVINIMGRIRSCTPTADLRGYARC
jgi:type IV fimbrial biogenesis protein FimT